MVLTYYKIRFQKLGNKYIISLVFQLKFEDILEKADYLINQSINQGTIDNDLNKIQKKLENELK